MFLVASATAGTTQVGCTWNQMSRHIETGDSPGDDPVRYHSPAYASDRDIRAELAQGRLAVEPFDDTLVQPSSIDVRLDGLFRVFNNTTTPHRPGGNGGTN